MVVTDTFRPELAARLRDLFRERGKQAWAADKAGIPRNTVNNWVNGRNEPSLREAAKLSRALDISLDWLATGQSISHLPSEPELMKEDVPQSENGMIAATGTQEVGRATGVILRGKAMAPSLSRPNSAGRLADRLREARGKVSQTEAAQALGVTKQTIGNYERGVREPDATFLADICRVFGVTPEWLLLGRGPQYPQHPQPTGMVENEGVIREVVQDVYALIRTRKLDPTPEELAELVILQYRLRARST